MPPTQNPPPAQGLPVDPQRKLRRLVLAGSVGTSVLLAVLLAVTDPHETSPTLALASVPASPPAESAHTDGTDTYPIPAQAVAAEVASPPLADPEAVTAAPMAVTKKTEPDATKPARNNHVPLKKAPANARPDAKGARGRGVVGTTSSAPAAPDAAPNAEASTAPAELVVKKRVPLVDEQPRVRILD